MIGGSIAGCGTAVAGSTPCTWGLLWRSLRASAEAARCLRGEPVTSVRADAAGQAVITSARGDEPYDLVVGAEPGPYVQELAREHSPAAWADIVARAAVGRRPATRSPVCRLPGSPARPCCWPGTRPGVTRPHTATGAVKALQDALCLERVLRAGPDLSTARERYADERSASGAQSVELGRRMGRAPVEEVPDWPAMGQDEVDVWFRAVPAGTWHYLYEEPGQAAGATPPSPEAAVGR